MKVTRQQLRRLIAESLLVESEDRIEQLKREFNQLMNLLKDPKLDNAVAEDYFMRAEDIQAEIANLVNQKYNTPNVPQVIDKVNIDRAEFEDAFDDFGNANEIVPYQQTHPPNFSKKAFEKEIDRRNMIQGSLAGTAAAAFAMKTGLGVKPIDSTEQAIDAWFKDNLYVNSEIDNEIVSHIEFMLESSITSPGESMYQAKIYDSLTEMDNSSWYNPLRDYLNNLDYGSPELYETYIDNAFDEYFDKLYNHERVKQIQTSIGL